MEEFPPNILREVDKNFEELNKKYQEVKEACQYVINEMENNKEININRFIDELIKIQPFSSLGNLIGQNWKSSKRIKEIFIDYRNKYDKIIYQSTEYLSKILKKYLPKEYKEYFPVMTLDEIRNPYNTDVNELKKRKNGYIYYDGKIHIENISEFCQNNGFTIELNETKGDIRGNIAYRGIVKGKVKIVLSHSDFDKFNEGDILVTTMTTPRFTSVMKKAAGIITNEGGITCHASIIARELKKPCLVGCKNATEVLKDNMQIKLDAVNGVVNIL